MGEKQTMTIPGTDIEAEIEYEYQQAEKETRYDPGYDSYVEISSVMIDNQDIQELISDEAIEEMETELCIKYEESAYETRCEAKIDRYEERRQDLY